MYAARNSPPHSYSVCHFFFQMIQCEMAKNGEQKPYAEEGDIFENVHHTHQSTINSVEMILFVC